MIVEMVAVLAGEVAESVLGALLDRADRMPERIDTPEKQENLEKVQQGYKILVEALQRKKQELKDLL